MKKYITPISVVDPDPPGSAFIRIQDHGNLQKFTNKPGFLPVKD
jgi:hypothetical protein